MPLIDEKSETQTLYMTCLLLHQKKNKKEMIELYLKP